MKTFKVADAWISTILILAAVVTTSFWTDRLLFTGYFAVGGWQIISMIVHRINGKFMIKGGSRSVYHVIVLIIIAIVVSGLLFSPLLIIFWVLLFISPLMAIAYTVLCFREIKRMNTRPLSLLK